MNFPRTQKFKTKKIFKKITQTQKNSQNPYAFFGKKYNIKNKN